METSPILFIKILQLLADRYGLSCTLEELTSLLTPVFNASNQSEDSTSLEKEKQATVLDALIRLDHQGYIFLNTLTDKSSISIKGLIELNNKILCN